MASRKSRSKFMEMFEQLETRRMLATYYVAPTGNDLNPGTSAASAWQSLSRLNGHAFAAGDQILLQGGVTFSGKIFFDANDAGSLLNPIKVGSYGTGRATISSGTEFGIFAHNTAGFEISNLNVAGAGATNTSGGIFFYNDRYDGAKLAGITISNVDVSGYHYGIEIGGGKNAATGSSSNAGFKNITISHSLLHDNLNAGLFTFGANYNVNEKVWVHHVKAYNNIGTAAYEGVSGHGILLGSVNGATVERCVAYNNGAAGNGGAGIWAYDSTKVLFQFNESHHNRTGGPHDGDGFDFDQNVSSSVMQYNYSHDNDGAGFLMATKFNNSLHNGNVIRYNISENDARKLDYGALHIWGKVLNSEWYNNTVYITPNATGKIPQAVKIINDSIEAQDTQHAHFRNNIFQTTGGVPLLKVTSGQLSGSIDLRFENNVYYSSGAAWKVLWGSTTYTSITGFRNTGQEKLNGASVGTSANPLLVAPGAGGTITNIDQIEQSVGAYKLQSASPMRDGGVNMLATFGINPGTRDFWATALPQGEAYEIGAHELLPTVTPPPPPPPPPTGQTPFLGSPFVIGSGATATIQAEDFDNGGEGVAYHDLDLANNGGKYRSTGVDIEATTGGYNIGYIRAGEWLEYTVNVTAGTYDLQARVASKGIGGNFRIEFGGANVTGSIDIADTGGWQNFVSTAAKRITLAGGEQVMRIYFESNGSGGHTGNLDWLKLTPVVAPPPSSQTPYKGTPFAIGTGAAATIQAEDFDNGGEGIAYHDIESTNYGGAYRSTGVDIETNAAGHNVGYIKAGEWLEYTVDVTAGTYDLQALVASKGTGGTFRVEFGGVDTTGSMSIADTGGWQTFKSTATRRVTLAGGEQMMRVYFQSNGSTGYVGNVDSIRLTAVAATPAQTPYSGTPLAITRVGPATIQAENFDNGGEGIAYHDLESTNFGGAYRSTGVDVQANAGGYNVGYTKAGEWLEYTVNVTAGAYDLQAMVASKGAGGTFRVEFGGVDVSGSIAIPNTGSWTTYTLTPATRIMLAGGEQVMRIYFQANGSTGSVGNLDWLKLTPVA